MNQKVATPNQEESPWLVEHGLWNKEAFIFVGLAKRCLGCGRVTHVNYLVNKHCPDCRKESP